MPEKKVTVTANTVTLYPAHWDTIEEYARVMGYGSKSAALRRIVDEWASFKAAFDQPQTPVRELVEA